MQKKLQDLTGQLRTMKNCRSKLASPKIVSVCIDVQPASPKKWVVLPCKLEVRMNRWLYSVPAWIQNVAKNFEDKAKQNHLWCSSMLFDGAFSYACSLSCKVITTPSNVLIRGQFVHSSFQIFLQCAEVYTMFARIRTKYNILKNVGTRKLYFR